MTKRASTLLDQSPRKRLTPTLGDVTDISNNLDAAGEWDTLVEPTISLASEELFQSPL